MISKPLFIAVLFCAACVTADAQGADPRLAQTAGLLNDYVAKETGPEKQVRDHMLKLTPLGSSPDQVQKVIKDELHKPVTEYQKNYTTDSPQHQGAGAQPSPTPMYVAGSIGLSYRFQKGWFFQGTSTYTVVVWYFDDQDHLMNVIAQRIQLSP